MNVPAPAPSTPKIRTLTPNQPLGWLALAVPVLVFTLIWYRYAVNVPKWDDHALKAFLFNFQQEPTLSGKIYQLFRQHNEHRIVWDRLITWLDYSLFGRFSYVRLMAVGNLSLVGLLVLFAWMLRRGGRSIWYAVPVACLLFNLSHWENMFWGMAALANFGVMSWIAGSLYLLLYTRHYWVAMGLAVLATATIGIGLAAWPITLVLLGHRTLTQPPQLRNWRPLIGQGAGAVLCIGLYFTGYEKPVVTPSASVGLPELIQGWLAFTGSAAEAIPFGNAMQNCILLGGVLVLLCFVVGVDLLRHHPLTRPWPPLAYFFVGLAGFILLAGAVVTWSRVGFGFDTLTTSRYKIYSLTLLSLLFVYAAVTLPQRLQQAILWVGLLAGGALAWLSYPAYIDDTRRLQQYLLTAQFNWTYTQNRPASTIDAKTARLINNAPAPYDGCLAPLFGPATAPLLVPDTLYRVADGFVLTVNNPALTDPDAPVYVRLHTSERTYLFPTEPVLNTSRWAALGLASRFRAGRTAAIQQGELMKGTYQLDLTTLDNAGLCTIHPTGQRITVTKSPPPALPTNW